MALERPVVAAAVGGVSEVVVHGETGILVPSPDPVLFANAFQALASQPSHARMLGVAGRRRYERIFTAERMVEGYADLFQAIIRSRQGRRNWS
jgi:glycosyltransferase involved in cell wall biosynthesis